MSTLVLIAVVTAIATEVPAYSADSPQAVERQVRTALRHCPLDGLAGTISFDRTVEQPDKPASGTQHWTITIDGKGELHAKVTWPDGEAHCFGRSGTSRWLLLNRDLLILQQGAKADEVKKEGRLELMESELRTAESCVTNLLGEPSAGGPADVVSIEPDPARPSVVARFGDASKQLTFDRTASRMVLASMQRADELCTYRWEYARYRQIGSGWFPGHADFTQDCPAQPSRALRARYSNIDVAPAADPDAAAFRRLLQIPQPDEPNSGPIVVVTTFGPGGMAHAFPAEAAAGLSGD